MYPSSWLTYFFQPQNMSRIRPMASASHVSSRGKAFSSSCVTARALRFLKRCNANKPWPQASWAVTVHLVTDWKWWIQTMQPCIIFYYVYIYICKCGISMCFIYFAYQHAQCLIIQLDITILSPLYPLNPIIYMCWCWKRWTPPYLHHSMYIYIIYIYIYIPLYPIEHIPHTVVLVKL